MTFTWVNDLTFDEMLVLAASLPPRSFILYVLLMMDAAGVTHNEDEALQRLHEVSAAPIMSLYRHHVGLGTVGGGLQAERKGAESARVAIRILRGKSATVGTADPAGASRPDLQALHQHQGGRNGGGRLWAENQVGGGAVLHVVLPVLADPGRG